MSLESNLYATLSADAGVTALCSDRIYPVVAPQGVSIPYVVWQVIAKSGNTTHDGGSGLDRVLVQFTSCALTYSAAHDLKAAVRAALETATLADGAKCIFQTERENYEEDTRLHVHQLDLAFWQPL